MCSIAVNKPHAVAIPFPLQGHISPLYQLCRSLVSSGFVVTFINTEGYQSRMKNVLNDEGLDIRFETVPGAPPDLDIFYQDNRLILFKSVEEMEGQVEALLRNKIAEKGPPVSCLISDMFLSWSRNVAHRLELPNVAFWTASAISLLLDFNALRMLEHGDIPVHDPSLDKTVNYVRGVATLPIWAIPSVFSARDAVYDVGFARRHQRTVQAANDAWILINSFEELEGDDAFEATTELNTNSIAVGPLLLSPGNEKPSVPSLWSEDQESLSWLAEQETDSVLYIALGSIATLSLEQFMEISEGLEELQRPFLWALRPQCVTNFDEEALNSFKASVSGFGRVVTWAPQLEILRHPSTGGFLSHCGWNSTLESLCAGVPMICWPLVAEQNLNCKLVVEDWKIGLKLSNVITGKVVLRAEFVEVVKALMEDQCGSLMRKNAMKLEEKARKAVSSAGSSFKNFQTFVEAIKSCSRQAMFFSH